MTLNEYEIENAVRQAKRNDPQRATHHTVVSFLRGSKCDSAAEQYLKSFERFDDLSALLERTP